MKITLAEHYGFCFGVKTALEIAKKTIKEYPNEDIFMLNKIVHNKSVCDELVNLGIKILDDNRSLEEKINSIEKGVVIFSAHGHDKKLEEIAQKKNLIIVDATCTRVLQNEKSIYNASNQGKKIIYIGIKNHPETLSALSLNKEIIFIDFFNPTFDKINENEAYSIHNQTTLIKSELNKIYDSIKKISSSIEIKNDICYATELRQDALKKVKDEDVIFIIGDKISSNTTRLYEVSKNLYPNKVIFQIVNINDLLNLDLTSYKSCFITAGASVPDSIINPIINYLSNY